MNGQLSRYHNKQREFQDAVANPFILKEMQGKCGDEFR